MASEVRVSKTQYYLSIAKAIAQRSTCLDNKYGAIIVKNDEIIATGYNGSPRGKSNCCDNGHCAKAIANKYEACVAVHAEQNAMLQAARKDMIGSTLYLVSTNKKDCKPCDICMKLILNAGIKYIVTERGYIWSHS